MDFSWGPGSGSVTQGKNNIWPWVTDLGRGSTEKNIWKMLQSTGWWVCKCIWSISPCSPEWHLLDIPFSVFFNCFFLRILASYEALIAEICNFWTFMPIIQLINHLFKIWQKAFLPNAHRCKKCTDIYIYGVLGKKAFCRILKRWFISSPECPELAYFCYFSLTHSKYP